MTDQTERSDRISGRPPGWMQIAGMVMSPVAFLVIWRTLLVPLGAPSISIGQATGMLFLAGLPVLWGRQDGAGLLAASLVSLLLAAIGVFSP